MAFHYWHFALEPTTYLLAFSPCREKGVADTVQAAAAFPWRNTTAARQIGMYR